METKVIQYNNCELSKIRFIREWVIGDFGIWISKNKGQWLNDKPFSPVQGIKLQIKIFGTSTKKVRIFLKNCGLKPIALADCRMKFTTKKQILGDYVVSSEVQKKRLSLAISEEFQFDYRPDPNPQRMVLWYKHGKLLVNLFLSKFCSRPYVLLNQL